MIELKSAQEIREIAVDLREVYNDFWPGLLFGGDRILHCDEGMVAMDDTGNPIGLASIAPKGESGMGVPEIVSVYVVPPARRKGVGLALLKASTGRCQERGLEPSIVAVTVEGKGLVAKYFKEINHGSKARER